MEAANGGDSLQRTPSYASTASNKSRKSSRPRAKSRKNSRVTPSASNQVTPTTANTDKSLTSFPSLSPENSPNASHDGRFGFKSPLSGGSQRSRTASRTKSSIVSSLINRTPSSQGRTALFEDSPAATHQAVPGALHHAGDEAIRRLIQKTGGVALVRQLAEDLAQRDAEITAFRWRAEERERELKKMLREVEVSNLNIEMRLHQLDHPPEDTPPGKAKRASPSGQRRMSKKDDGSPNPAILEMVGQAMNEEVGFTSADEDEFGEGYDAIDGDATVRGKNTVKRDVDGKSVASSVESNDAASALRGWKDYLWSKDRRSSNSNSALSENDNVANATVRGRNGTAAAAKRKGLNNDLFQPLQRRSTAHEGDIRASSVAKEPAGGTRSRGSSTSVASWTLKLFAGNPQSKQEVEATESGRGRAKTDGTDGSGIKPTRNTSKSSIQTASSARASLMRVSSRSSNLPMRKSITPLSLGPNGTLKGSAPPSTQNQVPGSPASIDSAAHNLGPVEMDTILPLESRPPTLNSMQNIDESADYLTDRFGFIYDQRRRKKEAESMANSIASKSRSASEVSLTQKLAEIDANQRAASNGLISKTKPADPRPDTPSSIDTENLGKPAKRWQDYLKVSNFPAELLSNTPSPSTFIAFANADIKKSLKRSPTFGDSTETAPSLSPASAPAASSVTAENAEMAKPNFNALNTTNVATSITGDQQEPVKLLLAQLTDLHDSLQREKTLKWNEFMRKIRAERRKDNVASHNQADRLHHASSMPETSLNDGEIIGIATVGIKGKVGRAKYKEFKSLVLSGIPVVHRAKVWAECSGAAAMRVPGYYDELVRTGIDDAVILAQIQMDINRTLTDNVFFRKGPGVAKLKEVLLVYARRNPDVGYCQGMNLITASLLLIMPTAEDAFWVLVSIVENILPRHYYNDNFLTSRADQQVLRQYVTEILPKLSAHLDALGIELEALTFQWFLSVFTDCLSAEALYRVWDVLLCCKDEDGNGGSTFLFQVALALLKLNETQLCACETPAEFYSYLGGEITNHAIGIDGLIRASEGLRDMVRRGEVEARRERWVEAEREVVRERERIRNGAGKRVNREGGSTTPGSAEWSEGELAVQSPMPVSD